MSDVIRQYQGMVRDLKWRPDSPDGKKLKVGPMPLYPFEPPTPEPPKIDGVPPVPGQKPAEDKRFKLA